MSLRTTSAIVLVALILVLHVSAAELSVVALPPLDRGFRLLYNLDFAQAHGIFAAYEQSHPNDPLGPDELMKPTPVLWPETEVVPFHYEHPVTGQKWHAA